METSLFLLSHNSKHYGPIRGIQQKSIQQNGDGHACLHFVYKVCKVLLS